MGKKKTKLPRGTFVERDLYRSRAFLSLGGFAPQLLLLFLDKRKREFVTDKKGGKSYTWTNLDSLTMTYKELENIFSDPVAQNKSGISRPRIVRAMDELLAKGFLEIRHQGGGYKQDKSIYSLCDKWTFWKPGTVFSTRKHDVHRGYQDRNKKARSKANGLDKIDKSPNLSIVGQGGMDEIGNNPQPRGQYSPLK